MKIFKKSTITENNPTKMGNQPLEKRLIKNLRLIELHAMKTKERKLQSHLTWNENAVANIMLT